MCESRYSVTPAPGRPGRYFLSTPMRDLVISGSDARQILNDLRDSLELAGEHPFGLPAWPLSTQADDALEIVYEGILTMPVGDLLKAIRSTGRYEVALIAAKIEDQLVNSSCLFLDASANLEFD